MVPVSFLPCSLLERNRVDTAVTNPKFLKYLFYWSDHKSLNKELMDSSLWIRMIASPKRGATGRTVILSIRFSGGIGMVSVMTTSFKTDFFSFSTAFPDKIAWVQEA